MGMPGSLGTTWTEVRCSDAVVLLPLGWLYLVILWLTWTPTGTSPAEILLSPSFSPTVVMGNLLLFAPFGFVLASVLAMRRRADAPPRRVAGRRHRVVVVTGMVVALLSLLVELGQLRVPGRSVSPWDVVMNTAGGLGAAWIALELVRSGVGAGRLMVVGAAPVFVGVLVFLSSTAFAATGGLALRDWNPAYPILTGADADGERVYRGTVSSAQICALPGEDRVCVEPGAPRDRRDRMRLAALDFQRVEVSASVWSDRPQEGPARIVTFSGGWRTANLMLGQAGRDLVFRLRTPLGGINGSWVEFTLPDAVPHGTPTEVFASYDGDRVVMVARSERGEVTGTFAWGFLSGWWMMKGLRDRRVDPDALFRSSLVAAAAFTLPVTLAMIWLGWGAGAFLVFAGVVAPMALLSLMGLALGVATPLHEMLAAGAFGGAGAALAAVGRIE